MARILYVEDNEDNIYVLESRLKRKGFDVMVARDGEAGVKMALELDPALVVMDLSLPVLDGWEATRQLREHPATRDLPILALSAHAMTGERERALEAGCNDFDTKPIQFKRLLGKIQALLEHDG